ncbi:MAG: hypothetical protein QNK37_00150 [Acidobacteriota bacterium]|nr:hypothetical protein [Acidobacteriota bacterium]
MIKKAYPFGPPEEQREEFYYSLSDIDTDGEHIFLRITETGLIELDPDGRHIRTFGKPGTGPAFLTTAVGQAVTPDLIWIIDFRQRLLCFERNSGEFLYRLHLDVPKGKFSNYLGGSTATNTLVAVDHNLLLPMGLSQDSRNIATLFDDQGTVVKDIMDPDYKRPLGNDIHTWGRTLWAYADGYWYCAYMHDHKLLKFDADFNKVYEVTLNTPDTRWYEDAVNYNISQGNHGFVPYFWDIALFGDHVYLLFQGGIAQFEKATGAFKRNLVYIYMADQLVKDEWKYLSLNFTTFTILRNGQVILATGSPQEFSDDLFQSSILDN